jgi:glycosyltransferase involved in cell wall biosynthesis
MNLKLSVVICSHNPVKAYIDRTIDALKHQSLAYEQWELILIDNASKNALASEIDLSWHPNASHVLEPTLGLTYARQAGIKNSKADIIVFVDDDNILDLDYLEHVLEISIQHPTLGAWGGQAQPEFEIGPEAWAKPYLWMLAIRELDTDRWANIFYCDDTTPCGAGLCVKRSIAKKYSAMLKSDPKRQNLGRKGQSLISCEDIDLAYTACDNGLGTGVFSRLKLTHIIPAKRLQEDYLLRLAEANGYSKVIVQSLRHKFPQPTFKMSSIDREFSQAFRRGHDRALKEISHLIK